MADGEEILQDIIGESIRLTWQDRTLGKSILEGDARVRARAMAIMEYEAPKVEAHMKTNAPWVDRTGNARQGLRAEAFEEADNLGIILYHTVVYGIYLELAHSGNFAIINPTIEIMGPQVMRALEGMMESI